MQEIIDMRYTVFVLPLQSGKSIHTDFKIIAVATAIFRKIFYSNVYVFDTAEKKFLLVWGDRLITYGQGSQELFYYCVACKSLFGCMYEGNRQNWCSGCKDSERCCAVILPHSRSKRSHGLCRDCFKEINNAKIAG